MEGRHKEFNQYLVKCGSISALTKAFAKLFEMTDDERPENAIWFVQQHMSPDDKVQIVDIIEYENIFKEIKKVMYDIEKASKVDPNAQSPQVGGDTAGTITDTNTDTQKDANGNQTATKTDSNGIATVTGTSSDKSGTGTKMDPNQNPDGTVTKTDKDGNKTDGTVKQADTDANVVP